MISASIICLVGIQLLGITSIFADEDVLLDIPQGTLKGIKSTTVLSAKPLYSFMGIPYAKSLNGSNKFKVADPPEAWSGVYDATHEGAGCVSFCMVRQMIVGEDNCLFVNVYTPEPNKDSRKAVMVWFHGGAFNMGSSDRGTFGPDFLVEQDVVLVTVQYRLGAFGFLGTEDSAAPGNVGLKDQTAALNWVQDNIQYFGGCPKRVTIFGQSSGGASVQYHMISPMSAGLFAKAISQGGSAFATWAITYHPREAALKLAKILGIETTNSVELVNKLEQIPSYDIVEAAMAVDATENSMNGHWHSFIPCVEPDFGQDIFLPTEPWTLIKTGKIYDVPYMAGLNLNETLFTVAALSDEAADMMNKNFENFIPDDLNVTDVTQRKKIADSMRKFYLDDKPLTKDSKLEYAKMTMDILFSSSLQIPLTIINSVKSTPTFNYLFTYDSPLGMFKELKFYDGPEGVLHGDELGYIFFGKSFRPKPSPGSIEEKMVHLMTKLWTNFAKTGDPTSVLDDDVTVVWQPMGNKNYYADINQALTIRDHMIKERIDFWVEIYKNVIGEYSNLF